MSHDTKPHRVPRKAGHIHCLKGLVPEKEVEVSVAHHAREAKTTNEKGQVERHMISTRHTEYRHNGELVRRDVHVGIAPSAEQVPHDSPGHNETPISKMIVELFRRRDDGLDHLAFAGGAALAPNPFDEALREARRRLGILAGITTALLTSWKVEILKALHDFTNGADVFKLALFKAQALLTGTYDAATTGYAIMTGNNDELANGNGYATGGVALVNTTPQSTGTIAYTTPAGPAQWSGATFTTRGAMGYNSTKANRGWFVYDFGADEPVVAGTLTISMPTNSNTLALTRIS
jgi:hypothetical protein